MHLKIWKEGGYVEPQDLVGENNHKYVFLSDKTKFLVSRHTDMNIMSDGVGLYSDLNPRSKQILL